MDTFMLWRVCVWRVVFISSSKRFCSDLKKKKEEREKRTPANHFWLSEIVTIIMSLCIYVVNDDIVFSEQSFQNLAYFTNVDI